MKTLDEIQKAVVKALIEIQTINGEDQIDINGETCPIGDLPGFDSFHLVEASVLIGVELNCEIDEKILFLPSFSSLPLSVDEIVIRISENLLHLEEKNHGRKRNTQKGDR